MLNYDTKTIVTWPNSTKHIDEQKHFTFSQAMMLKKSNIHV